ncbi:maltokinase N-terminal cap-like domain-containing protein [Actinosynnema sp. CS-041913]|uniref:maltokinase N-terminal cap-like domain-containing protein n=1 Tax=Actinosynnema sp. CS-041913 TaxID=3239917 RepID=UPI003D8B8A33
MSELRPRLERALTAWLPWQRWFGGKGRPVDSVAVVQAVELVDQRASGGPLGLLTVAEVRFTDGGIERYQVPVGVRTTLPDRLAPAVLAGFDGCVVYDATGDTELNSLLLRLIGQHAHRDTLHFVPEPGSGFSGASRRGLVGRTIGVEQSNTSIVFGDRYILKLYRRIAEGVNPDLDAHRALRRARSPHIAALLGAVEGTLGDAPATFGMLQSFAAGSAEGWEMALTSVRDLFAAPDTAPDTAGADFAAEARRLGNAVAAVHADLARELGTGQVDARDLSADMVARLDASLTTVPALAPYADRVRAALRALEGRVPVQRIHGDLHLGQVLRTPRTWLLIDFEGEPAAPIAERIALQSPLRDVAGMLRSFDYAAQHQVRLFTGPSGQLWRRARQWAAHNRAAFCAGYAEVAGFDPSAQQALLTAFELEKAVYETVYETRNRPDWVDIPLRAVRRLVGES